MLVEMLDHFSCISAFGCRKTVPLQFDDMFWRLFSIFLHLVVVKPYPSSLTTCLSTFVCNSWLVEMLDHFLHIISVKLRCLTISMYFPHWLSSNRIPPSSTTMFDTFLCDTAFGCRRTVPLQFDDTCLKRLFSILLHLVVVEPYTSSSMTCLSTFCL